MKLASEGFEVDVSDDETGEDLLETGTVDDDALGVAPDGEPEGERKLSNKERHRERGRKFGEQRRKEEEERERRHQAELAEMKQSQAQLQGQLQAMQAQVVSQQQPMETEVERITREMNTLRTAYGRGEGLNEEQRQQMDGEYRALELDRSRAVTREELQQYQSQQPDPQQQAMQTRAMMIRQQYPDVFGNQHLASIANIQYQQALYSGKPQNEATLHEVMTKVRQEHLGQQPNKPQGVDEASAGKYGDRSYGATGAAQAKPGKVRLDRKEMEMADALYSYIPDEKKRYERYARNIMAKVKA